MGYQLHLFLQSVRDNYKNHFLWYMVKHSWNMYLSLSDLQYVSDMYRMRTWHRTWHKTVCHVWLWSKHAHAIFRSASLVENTIFWYRFRIRKSFIFSIHCNMVSKSNMMMWFLFFFWYQKWMIFNISGNRF